MHWKEFELLEEVGLTGYERKALVTLMIHGVADAETLCRKGEVPSSKISRQWRNLLIWVSSKSNQRGRDSTPR